MTPAIMSARIVCPGCAKPTFANEAGNCPRCDTRLVADVPAEKPLTGRYSKRFATRGHPIYMTEQQVTDAYHWYTDHGLSLRACARRLWPDTAYKSAKTVETSLADQWRIRDWPLRDRIAATVTASYRHGLARDRDHRLQQRIARGEIRGVQCAATKIRPGKGRGERCQRAALAGRDYCISHDPDRDQERAQILAHARASRRHR